MTSESRGVHFTHGILPTITKSHAQGLWVTSLGDVLQPSELLAAQGYGRHEVAAILQDSSSRVLAEMAGNSFTVTVLQRLLQALLPAIGA